MTKLHKIYLVIVGALVLIIGFFAIKYSVSLARAEEQQKATDQVIAAKNQALTDRDKTFEAFKDQVQQQIATMTAKQAVTVIQPVVSPAGQPSPQQVTKAELPPDVQKALPGAANTNYTLLSDPQMVLLGQREKSCQLTEAGLTKCDADALDYKAQIASLTKSNNEWKAAGAVPRWTAGLGVARAGGSEGYTPALFIDYRIQSKWGLFMGAENKAVFAGVSVHFGSEPK
jgi:hypothetical protein